MMDNCKVGRTMAVIVFLLLFIFPNRTSYSQVTEQPINEAKADSPLDGLAGLPCCFCCCILPLVLMFMPFFSQIKKAVVDQNFVYEVLGLTSWLHVYDDRVIITPAKPFWSGGRGAKSIPFSSISSIQFKIGGFMSGGPGHLRFTIPGGVERIRGAMDFFVDENSFTFLKSKNEVMIAINNFIENRIIDCHNPKSAEPTMLGLTEQLKELAALHSSGVISPDEFQAAKRRLLGQ